MNSKVPLFIAEISANHLGDFERARSLVKAAVAAGATAVKFQTYTAETMTLDSELEEFKISAAHPLWGGRKLFDLYDEAHTPWSWHEELFDICRSANVIPFSSPFDISAVDFLESINAPMYKIASMETGDHGLIRRVAETGKPLIISTGATELNEIDELVEVVEKSGNKDLTLLVCTSSYPADPADAHLRRIKTIRDRYGLKVGLSDHTLGIGVSIAAIALGATAIEKHLTLRRGDGGADGAFSMEPEEFSMLVNEGTIAFKALGNPTWRIQKSEMESRRLRRSLVVTQSVNPGDEISLENINSIRPNIGMPSAKLESVLGKKFNKPMRRGDGLHQSDILE